MVPERFLGSKKVRRMVISRRAFLSLTISGAVVCAAGCTPLQAPRTASPTAPPLRPLAFMAGYKPQANLSFVGVYVAQALGYFQAETLDVSIRHSSGQGEHTKLLLGKQIQVTTSTATGLVTAVAESETPLLSLAVITQRGDVALAALRKSGITVPRQLEGKTVGYKIHPSFEYLATLKAAGVDRTKIREVSVGFDPRILTEGKVDVIPVFKSNEPDQLAKLGFETSLIDPADFGVLVMGQTWTAHREAVMADPDLYARFVRAAQRGLSYSFTHPKETIDIVMSYAKDEDRAHQEFMLRVEQELAITEQTRTNGPGWQTLDQWAKLQDAMFDLGILKHKVDPQVFFTDRFLGRPSSSA